MEKLRAALQSIIEQRPFEQGRLAVATFLQIQGQLEIWRGSLWSRQLKSRNFSTVDPLSQRVSNW